MRIYLDNCCLNRPYDDQNSMKLFLETQAKLHIQQMIKQGRIELCSSYMLDYENSENPFEMRKKPIAGFLGDYAAIYVSVGSREKIEKIAADIMTTGVKFKDACHVACALLAECDVFLTTDKRLLKYSSESIKMMNPIEFFEEEDR